MQPPVSSRKDNIFPREIRNKPVEFNKNVVLADDVERNLCSRIEFPSVVPAIPQSINVKISS